MLLGQESVVDFSVGRSMVSLSDLLQAYKKETVLVRIISGEELNFRVRAHTRTHTHTHRVTVELEIVLKLSLLELSLLFFNTQWVI